MHSLDGLRGVAAVAVVVLHAWMYTERHRPDRSELAARVIGEFRLAVLCFFVLSGFLLALPWVAARAGDREPPQLGRFALRRLARIGPAYWVALAGSVAVLHESGHSRAVPFSELPKFALFAQNVFHSTRNQLDPPMWSMHVEATFYVALPLIGLALVHAGRGRARALAICGALVVANLVWRGVAVAWQLPPEARWTLPTYLGAFACGIAAAVLVADARRHPRTTALAGVAGVALVVADGAWYAAGPTTAGRIVADLRPPRGSRRSSAPWRSGPEGSSGARRCGRWASSPTASTCGTCRSSTGCRSTSGSPSASGRRCSPSRRSPSRRRPSAGSSSSAPRSDSPRGCRRPVGRRGRRLARGRSPRSRDRLPGAVLCEVAQTGTAAGRRAVMGCRLRAP